MSDNLSDEEARQFADETLPGPNYGSARAGILKGCSEWRRRAEAQMEERERKAFNDGWEALNAYAGDQGWHDPSVDPDMARDKAFEARKAAQIKT